MSHDHDHDHVHLHYETKEIELEKEILHKNDLLAERNRGYFDAKSFHGRQATWPSAW